MHNTVVAFGLAAGSSTASAVSTVPPARAESVQVVSRAGSSGGSYPQASK